KTTKWVRSKGYPIKNSQGRIYRVCGTLEDITEEKQAALHIRQLNRLYALLSGINSLVVRATDRSELLADACNIATTIGEFDLVWIGELHHGDNRIYPVAHSGPQEDIDALMSTVYTATTEKGGRQNIIQQTIAGLQPYWENHDLTTFGSGALHLNTYRSIICLPLINSEGVCGIALFYSRRAIVFDAREVAVLTDISKDISHGMSFIATRDRLNHLAFHDPVTGLANRARLRITLEQQIRDARVDNSPLALMLVNIIGFRDINNTFGHSAGDEILGDIAEALRAVQPAHYLIACLGGDEFAIIFPGAGDENTARDTAQRINECLAGTISIVGVPIHIEAQIGVALYPIHADSVDGLWMLADTALSLAASEQSHICIYNTCFDRTDPQSLALLGGVREAIENNQFELYWQPKLDLGANCVVGAEALIRWNHPVRGMLYPDTFIPQIEQTALIRPLTEWVMKAAIQQARQWQDAGYNLSVAINISVRNLQENNLHDRLIDQAREHGVPLEKIVVEVTESAVMGNVTQAVRVLGILANAGIRVAIDDFGTGHSSLVYLRDLPVTDMKIDKAFAMNLGSNGYTAIVKSAIKLAQNLDLSVTAEGVEDGESLAALRDMGCNIAQGYFISRPMRADQFIGWLEASSWRASPLSRSTIDSEKRSPG
ncbi:MAG: EAL domain-containing protein, partial [Spongiibacter sp.]|nr:EAL domain-containing protein [Spongiibacter sp.]